MLGRAPSTVSRELRRAPGRGSYRASTAQADADQRATRPKPGRLATSPRLHAEVVARLDQRHSPEQIAERLPVDFPDDPEMRVSHETIYKALYVQSRGELRRELTRRLRSGRTLRKPRKPLGQRKERFAGMVMIADRPPEVDDRAVPGHWEGDLVLGSTAWGPQSGPWSNAPPAT